MQSNYERIRRNQPSVNGVEMVGTLYNTFVVDDITIIEKAFCFNYDPVNTFFVSLLIRKLGQSSNNQEYHVVRNLAVPPGAKEFDELRNEGLDFPARIVGNVVDAVPSVQTGKVSFFMTITQLKVQ